MKHLLMLILLTIFFTDNIIAQRSDDRDIQDSVIGWWNNNRFDHFKPQTDALSKKKEEILNDMVKWMKTSYTPVGGLGTSNRYIGNKGYGVDFLVWSVSHDKQWTEPDGKFKPIPEENTQFIMAANRMFGAFPIPFINTGNEFYFVMQPDGFANNNQMMDLRKDADTRIHPNAHNYITWMNDWCTVYLTSNNKLPWVKVTKAELLQKAEDGIQKVLDDKRKVVAAQWPNNKKTQDEAYDYFKKDMDKYRNKIQQLRERYKSSLNEPAVIRDMQPNIYSFDIDPDIFKIDVYGTDLKHAFPVYKLDATTMSKLKSETPQWVAVAWPFETKERGNQLYEMHTAMSQNINYDYIYNYFFNVDKIKGKAYTAANAEQLKARLNAYKNTNKNSQNTVTKKQTNLPANVLLFDDFSEEAVGNKPAGWYYSTYGKAYAVSTVDGQQGHWLKMGYNNELSSTTVKNLPENFSIEYDIVTSNFDGRWGATVQLQMSGAVKSSDGVQHTSGIELVITAGNQTALEAEHDYRGEVRIRLTNLPSKMDYNDKGGFYDGAQPVFTNTQKKVHVKLLKQGAVINLYLNNKLFISSVQFKTRYGKDCGDCSIEHGLLYNKLTLKNLSQDADTVDCYIGNIKITKE